MNKSEGVDEDETHNEVPEGSGENISLELKV